MQNSSEEEYVEKQFSLLKNAVKQKHQNMVKESLKREYQNKQLERHPNSNQTQQEKKNSNQMVKQKQQQNMQTNKKEEEQLQNSNPQNQDKQEFVHYKKTRRDKHMEKNLQRQIPNHQQQYGTKKTQEKFNHYKSNFNEDYNKMNTETQQEKENSEKSSNLEKSQNSENAEEINENSNQISDSCESEGRSIDSVEDYRERRANYDKLIRQRRKEFNKFSYKSDYKSSKQTKLNYNEHLSPEEIEKGLENGEIFEGVYRQNKNVRTLGYIKCPHFEQSIHIESVNDQNRALHGCEVAFKITKWLPLKENERKYESQQAQIKLAQEDIVADNDDWEDISSDDELNKKAIRIQELSKMKLFGIVVFIKKNPYENEDIIGRIDFRPKSQKQQNKAMELNIESIQEQYYITFKPTNEYLVWFNLTLKNTDISQFDSFEVMKDYLTNNYYNARMKFWDIKSYYPECELVSEFGYVGDVNVETNLILNRFNIKREKFSQECEDQCSEAFVIPLDERQNRVDFGNDYLFTFGNKSNAFSIDKLEENKYKIGVHVPDVSYFIQPGNHIDKEAELRGSSINLVHRVVAMLPETFLKNVGSFNSNSEKLGLSILMIINSDGEALQQNVVKSIVKSCVQLNQEQVDKIIKDQQVDIPLQNGFDFHMLIEKIKLFTKLGEKVKEQRIRNGSYIRTKKQIFTLNNNNYPTKFQFQNWLEPFYRFQDFEILANQTIGKIIMSFNQEDVILRESFPIDQKKLEDLQKLLKQHGVNCENIDFSNAKQAKDLLISIVKAQLSDEVKQVLRFLLNEIIDRPYYFTNKIPKHPHSHFTSPLTRYGDILVHRKLSQIIQKEQNHNINNNINNIAKQLDCANNNRIKARYITKECNSLFLHLYFKTNPTEAQVFVTNIGDSKFEFICPNYGIKLSCPYSQLKFDYKLIKISDYLEKKQDEELDKQQDQDEQKQQVKQQDKCLIIIENKEEGSYLHSIQEYKKIKVQLDVTSTSPIEIVPKLII